MRRWLDDPRHILRGHSTVLDRTGRIDAQIRKGVISSTGDVAIRKDEPRTHSEHPETSSKQGFLGDHCLKCDISEISNPRRSDTPHPYEIGFRTSDDPTCVVHITGSLK